MMSHIHYINQVNALKAPSYLFIIFLYSPTLNTTCVIHIATFSLFVLHFSVFLCIPFSLLPSLVTKTTKNSNCMVKVLCVSRTINMKSLFSVHASVRVCGHLHALDRSVAFVAE
eukprot:913695_1